LVQPDVPYLLDSNVFIEAKNRHYGFDFCPAFWNWIEAQSRDGRVFSVRKVAEELAAGADELAQWAARNKSLFLDVDGSVQPSLRQTSVWASSGRYEPAAVSTFLQAADYYLVAQAHAHGYVVVTHEVSTTSTRRIKIPDACASLGVRCVTPYDMLRTEKARFILGPAVAT
jgi:uncharacterized protein DUF4411